MGKRGPKKGTHWKQNRSLTERLLSNVEIDPEEGCWRWVKSSMTSHYGQMGVRGTTERSVHRLAWIEWVGPIPEDMKLDHECHNRAVKEGTCEASTEDGCRHRLCINPEHLTLKPQGENLMASPLTQCSINSAKTECKRGHPFDETNTGRRRNGNRYCKACAKMTTEERAAWDAEHAV